MESIKTLCKGVVQLSTCLWHTAKDCAIDCASGIKHHPILATSLVITYIVIFVAMGNARAERDNLNKEVYTLTQQNDSLSFLCEDIIKGK